MIMRPRNSVDWYKENFRMYNTNTHNTTLHSKNKIMVGCSKWISLKQHVPTVVSEIATKTRATGIVNKHEQKHLLLHNK